MRIIDYTQENYIEMLNEALNRTQLDYGDVPAVVAEIVENVRSRGDEAIFEYTKKFDGAVLDKQSLMVTKEEIQEAYVLTGNELTRVLEKSASRIGNFHAKQKRSSWFDTYSGGEIMGQLFLPLERVGIYAPGGKAAYPSSVLMNIIPAKTAGVKNIVMCTPPGKNGKINPAILAAADLAGADEIYKVGGAQAIAAMAFGTETIPNVDKIAGPGNIYVALAKRAVYGYVNIDSVAGPSEILIIADDTANYKYVAADLLSQAEHDELAASILLTTSRTLAKNVAVELETLLEKTGRKAIAEVSIRENGACIVVDSIERAFDISNIIAPEHLEICAANAFALLPMVKNAGAVFLGNYTPEALGDYIAGPNHILPTGGTARFFSPLNVDDFIKKTSILHFDKKAFDILADDCISFAEAEKLFAHADAVRVRQGL